MKTNIFKNFELSELNHISNLKLEDNALSFKDLKKIINEIGINQVIRETLTFQKDLQNIKMHQLLLIGQEENNERLLKSLEQANIPPAPYLMEKLITLKKIQEKNISTIGDLIEFVVEQVYPDELVTWTGLVSVKNFRYDEDYLDNYDSQECKARIKEVLMQDLKYFSSWQFECDDYYLYFSFEFEDTSYIEKLIDEMLLNNLDDETDCLECILSDNIDMDSMMDVKIKNIYLTI